ncbi:MAG: hypothetical protein ACE5DM_05915 [Candidatus Nanoarchaeia archaeon]
MKNIRFTGRQALISAAAINKERVKLKKELDHMRKVVRDLDYDDDRASILLPTDKDMLNHTKRIIRSKSGLAPDCLVVVGIGGSNLGTVAVQEAVLGKYHNQKDPKVKVLSADTVDADSISDIIRIIEPVLKRKGNVILNGVSKSGGTTETIANLEVLIDVIKKHKKDYEKYVVVTTGRGSRLWKLADKKGFTVLEIPRKVGGRFSVFSPVGLFPLGILGISIDHLLAGAASMRARCLQPLARNPAAISASLSYLNSRKGKTINDLFLFSKDLESAGKWYRQLMGESLGKEYDLKKRKVNAGITPTVSVGSTDLHSMAQLYLGGPYDKYTTFLRVDSNKSRISVPKDHSFDDLVPNIQGRPLKKIMDAIIEGVQVAFVKGKRPFSEISLPDKSAASVGQLLQFKMMEMMFLGVLMGVNTFDQPNVELYKVETKKILGE